MRTRYFRLASVVALTLISACGVHQTETPALTGPSTSATSLSITATPDSINYSINQSFASPATVKVSAHGPDGKPLVGQALRLDILVGGTVVDYGQLQTKQPVTGSDGTTTVVYLAPTAPPPPNDSTVSTVTIRATAVGNDAQANNPVTVDIRLIPVGLVQAPADTPTASFRLSAATVTTGTPVQFDASSSCGGPLVNNSCPTTASAIASYAWSFGDGGIAAGVTANHTYAAANTFNVSLTVTNARGVSASTTQAVSVTQSSGPTALFVFSPSAPNVGQNIVFNASQSTATSGHSIVSYSWIFGDGAVGAGNLASHAFSAAGSYNVTLTVTDDAGQKTTGSQVVSVSASTGGGGGGGTSASFVSSPSSPVVGQVVFFNASGSTAATGKTLTSYAWNFGDGTTNNVPTSSTSHSFTTPGTFTVSLVVTDSGGTTATATNNVVVTPAGAAAPTATFTFSPSSPGVGDPVFFNASSSTPGAGHTITTYAWTFGDGTVGTGVTTSHAYTASGSYGVQLKTTDEIGQSTTSAPTAITVGSPPAPTAGFTFSPQSPGRQDQVVFDASSSSTAQGQTIVDVAWNFGDGTTVIHCPGGSLSDCPGPTNRISAHTFTISQTFVVNLVVTDSAGRTGSINKSVSVATGDPTVVISAPGTGTVGSTIQFGSGGTTFYPGHNTNPGVTGPISYSWAFGDGVTSTAANPTHSYGTAGSYVITLSVTDEKGRTGFASVSITIS